MIRAIFSAMFMFALVASPALAGDMPAAYKKCKICHKMPGDGGKLGPDLKTSKYTLEQFQMQVKNGSKWDGRPPKQEKFAKKKMKPVKKVTEDDVKAIYDFVKGH